MSQSVSSYAPPTPPAPQKKRSPLLVIVAAAVAGAAGLAIGFVAAPNDTPVTAGPAPTVTVTRTVQAPPPSTSPTTEPPTLRASPSDFTISLKILKRECFGTSGCNYTYRIVPQYVGSTPLPDTGTIEVTYRVTGDEGGPIDNTFTVENGTASYDKTENASTNANSVKLKVKVTGVNYTP